VSCEITRPSVTTTHNSINNHSLNSAQITTSTHHYQYLHRSLTPAPATQRQLSISSLRGR